MENEGKLNEQQIRAEIETKIKQINEVQESLQSLRKENNLLLDKLADIMRCKYSQFLEQAVRVTGKNRFGSIDDIEGFLKGFRRYGMSDVIPVLMKLKKDGTPSKIAIPEWQIIHIDETFSIQLI